MKNIILFSTILAAGTLAANAASNIPLDLQESAVLFWNFDSGNTPNENPTNVTLNSPFRYESGYGVADSASTRTYSTDFSNSEIKANSFTVSFDVSNFVAADCHELFSMYTGNGTHANNAFWLEKDGSSSGSISFYVEGFAGAAGYTEGVVVPGLNYSTLNSSEKWTTITISSGETDTGEKFFKVYSDGVLKLTLALATTDAAITGFRFCGLLENDNWSSSAYFDNIAFWNEALDDDKIASFIVPEPSMFGLLAGIGALALAGTRRRKMK